MRLLSKYCATLLLVHSVCAAYPAFAIPPNPNNAPYNTTTDGLASPFTIDTNNYTSPYVNNDAFTNTIDLRNNITTNNVGTLTNNSGARFANNLGATTNNTGTFTNLTGSAFVNTGTFANNGSISIFTSNVGSSFTNTGTFTNAGGGTFTNSITAALIATTSGTFNNTAGVFYNTGSFDVNGLFKNAATLNNNGSSSAIGIRNTFNNTGAINNAGNINVNGFLTSFFHNQVGGVLNNSGLFDNNNITNNYGTINNNPGGQLRNIQRTFTNHAGGSIIHNVGATFLNNPGAHFINGGYFESRSTAANSSRNIGIMDNEAGAVFENIGRFQNPNGGTFNNKSGARFTQNVGAVVSVSVGATYNNSGLFENKSTVSGNSINSGTFNNNVGGVFNNISGVFTNSGTFNNQGTVNNDGGSTFINSNTLTNTGTFNSSGVLSSAAGSVVNNGTMTLTGNTTFGALSGSGTTVTTGNITLGGLNTSPTYSGTFSNLSSWTLTKQGTGVFTVNGNPVIAASSVSPTINVTAGSFLVGGSGANSSATLRAASVDVSSGAGFGGYGTTSVAGNANFANNSTYIVGINNTTAGLLNADTITIGSNATLQVQGIAASPLPFTYNVANALQSGGISSIFSNLTPVGFTEIVQMDYTSDFINLTVRQPTSSGGGTSGIDAGSTAASLASAASHTSSTRASTITGEELSFAANQPMVQLLKNIVPLQAQPAALKHLERKQNSPSITHAAQHVGPIVEDKDQYRVWMTPYYTHGRSDVAEIGGHSSTNTQGVLVGVQMRDLKEKWTLGFDVGTGHGVQKTPTAINIPSRLSSRDKIVGIHHSQAFWEQGLYEVSLHGVFGRHSASRFGKPLPTQLYMAHATFNSKTVLANALVSWRMHFPQFIFKPHGGVEVAKQVREAFTEEGAGSYNQSHARSTLKSFEPYVGITARKIWDTKDYVYKVTATLEEGYELGDKGSSGSLTVANAPDIITKLSQQGPGKYATYFAAYGSVLSTKTGIKVIAGYNATLQQRRTSHTISLKLEHRF